MALNNFRTQKIIWDRANKKIFEAIEANSGDSNGRKLVVQIINQEVTEVLSGTTLSLGWKSRNGAKGLDAFNVVDASKGIFEIYYTTEMLSNIGNIEASLILIDSTSRIESSTFTISVRPSTVDDESVESENSFTALTKALVKVNDFDTQLAKIEIEKLDRNENESITTAMLSPEIKQSLNDGVWNVNVNTSEIENGAVTSEKLNSDVGLFETVIPKFKHGYIDPLGVTYPQAKNYLITDYFVPYNKGDTLVLLGGSNNVRLLYRQYDKHKNLVKSSVTYAQQVGNREFMADSDGYIKIILSVYSGGTPVDINESTFDMLSNSVFLVTNRLKTVEVPKGNAKELIKMDDIDKSVGLIEQVHPPMTMGRINQTTGEPYFADVRIVGVKKIPIIEGEKLVFKGENNPNKRLFIYIYDKDGNYLSQQGMYIQEVTDIEFELGTTGYFNYTLHYQDDRVISGKNFKDLSKAVYHERYTLKALKNVESGVSKTMQLPLEAHGIDKTTGTIISTKGLLQTDNFTSMKRTGKYLRITPSSNITLNFSNGRAYVFEYNENFSFLGCTELNSDIVHELRPDANMIKISLEELMVDYPKAELKYSSNIGDDKWVYNDYRPNRLEPRANASFIYETSVNQGRSVLEPIEETQQISEERYFNSAILELPPNYDPDGDPVKLIIWNHGSGGFLYIDSWAIETSYTEQFDYLLNEGYAILGVFHKTTKYVGAGNVYVMPTAIAALANAYKHVIKNYNISKSGVYNAGKSSGGFNGALLSYGIGIPVLATGLLAPTFNPMNTPYGSHEGARMLVAEDFGFVGDHSVLSNNNGLPTPVRTPELRQYMIDNAEKMIGYNPWWNGLIGEDVKVMAAEAYDGNSLDYELNKNKNRIFPVPLKIWYAEDDDRASIPEQIPTYVKQIQNTNGNVEVRKMPVGTGGHNSVDSDPNALKIPSITTKLGITHTDVPVAYAELVSYFRRFGE